MIKCGAAPYEGKENYIFISYCHEDREQVFPVIESLAERRYRIWYDEGINPGSDWPEMIADHLDRCTIFLSFITRTLMESHNCRREINFAVLKGKPMITVYLEEVQLSAGMEMQLTTTQSVFRYEYDDFEAFLKKLCRGEDLDSCREENPAAAADLLDSDRTVRQMPGASFVLVRRSTGEEIRIDKPYFRIGRKADLCDYALEDDRTISRIHGIFNAERKKLFVLDNNSLNKIHVNGKKIEPMTNTELHDGDEIKLGSERFTVIIE